MKHQQQKVADQRQATRDVQKLMAEYTESLPSGLSKRFALAVMCKEHSFREVTPGRGLRLSSGQLNMHFHAESLSLSDALGCRGCSILVRVSPAARPGRDLAARKWSGDVTQPCCT